ncbi:hypothetical protein [Streptomyces sp. NPDC058228]|uniref:hypothetical protein n=1 Tax=Streptomyces sp. NPDC058228 TaxID=3346390 RepID=UPI0036F0F9F6
MRMNNGCHFPEGTDLRFTNHDEYWNQDRTAFNRTHIERSYSNNVAYGETYLPGHIWGRPHFHIPPEDGEGVIAGTMNHIAPYPRMELEIKKSKIVEIRGGTRACSLRRCRRIAWPVVQSGDGVMKGELRGSLRAFVEPTGGRASCAVSLANHTAIPAMAQRATT